ncbi:Nucleic acid-binding OB-fold [Penicillium hordei]|uniref:Nucleic acid-binding OB-fold n=1 Tax=Penicillium hordei TaxID=40994 RepID=A0AAD6EJI3_9EURO|nr:Nucleic acid-binding OB-fold [Penicillium hordei]KAJ5617844.1 Nucleic acid-binding OB-fold [Penicillium hordei]
MRNGFTTTRLGILNEQLAAHTQRSTPSTEMEEDLSDLLDTHQDRPTEVRRRDQVKIITTP